MNKLTYFASFMICLTLSLKGAETTQGPDESSPQIHGIVRNLDDIEAILRDVYPDDYNKINAEIQTHFGENNIFILRATNRKRIVVRGERDYTKSLLFFDEQGKSTALPHNNRGTLHVSISEHSRCCHSFPRVTALFDSGELIYFNRTGLTRQNPWNLKPVATLNNPEHIKGLAPFIDGECLYYSNNNLVVLNQNGEELWRYPPDHEHEEVAITGLTFTHPNLERIALCTAQLKLIEWKKTSLVDQIIHCNRTKGSWSEKELPQKPLTMYYRIDGRLELEYSPEGQS